jgi:hypothetical protein
MIQLGLIIGKVTSKLQILEISIRVVEQRKRNLYILELK